MTNDITEYALLSIIKRMKPQNNKIAVVGIYDDIMKLGFDNDELENQLIHYDSNKFTYNILNCKFHEYQITIIVIDDDYLKDYEGIIVFPC